jgi:hypothetical protein
LVSNFETGISKFLAAIEAEPSGLNQARAAAEKLARELGDAERTARELCGFLGL